MAAPPPRLTRRRLLTIAAAGVGAAAAGGGARLVLDPQRAELPRLAALPFRRASGRAEGELRAVARGSRMLYEGLFPGPVVTLREEEPVRLRFVNALGEPSNLHLHGLPIAPGVDAPFRTVASGARADYAFTLPAGTAGTYWYHPHLHGTVARQLGAGLAGPLVVRGELDALPELRGADDRLLVLRDAPEEAGRVLVNGVARARLSASRSLLRLRLVNASAGEYVRLALDAGPLQLIVTDAGALARPVAVPELLLAPGERAEVLVRLARPGEERTLRRLPYARAGGAAGTDPEDLLALRGPERPTPTGLPGALAPVARLRPADARVRRTFAFGVTETGVYTINGRPFDHHRVDVRARRGDLELWEVVNRHTSDHSFHLHTFPVQVLERDGRPEPLTAWRDVVNVPGGRRVLLGVPLRPHAGTTVLHCHSAEHEDAGMMATVQVRA